MTYKIKNKKKKEEKEIKYINKGGLYYKGGMFGDVYEKRKDKKTGKFYYRKTDESDLGSAGLYILLGKGQKIYKKAKK